MIVSAEAWRRAAEVAGDGFVQLPDLVVSAEERVAGIQSHRPIAALGGELAGRRLVLDVGEAAYEVRLEGPDGVRSLGSIEAPVFKQVNMDRQAESEPEWLQVRAKFPSVEQVSLLGSGGSKQILVVVSAHDGGHCSGGVLRTLTAPLPALGR